MDVGEIQKIKHQKNLRKIPKVFYFPSEHNNTLPLNVQTIIRLSLWYYEENKVVF